MNEQYGVTIKHFTVKNVCLPIDITMTMQKKTIFNSKEIELKKIQDLDMQKMDNENKLLKIKEEAAVQQQDADELQTTNKARMDQEIAAIKSATSKELAKIDADADAQVLQVISDGDLEVTNLQNERDK